MKNEQMITMNKLPTDWNTIAPGTEVSEAVYTHFCCMNPSTHDLWDTEHKGFQCSMPYRVGETERRRPKYLTFVYADKQTEIPLRLGRKRTYAKIRRFYFAGVNHVHHCPKDLTI